MTRRKPIAKTLRRVLACVAKKISRRSLDDVLRSRRLGDMERDGQVSAYKRQDDDRLEPSHHGCWLVGGFATAGEMWLSSRMGRRTCDDRDECISYATLSNRESVKRG